MECPIKTPNYWAGYNQEGVLLVDPKAGANQAASFSQPPQLVSDCRESASGQNLQEGETPRLWDRFSQGACRQCSAMAGVGVGVGGGILLSTGE